MSAKNGSIKLVAGNSNPALAQEIADWLHLPPTKAIVRRFADMEIFVEIQENVRGSDVFIIQSTSFPANDHLMELLIITDALRRASARRITAVVPYFGYARQDRKAGPRTPISAKLVANLITHAGADRVMTLDLHAGQIQGFFDIPTDNLYASPVMVRDIREQFDLTNVMVVSPDVGGVVRARGLAKRINAPLAIIDKRRERAGESEVMNVIGDVAGYTCILVDDIVDSGGTLVNAADALLANGAKEVYAYISHGVLSGGAAARISSSKLKELVITDSILPTEAVRNAPNIRTLSIAGLIAEAIGRTAAEEVGVTSDNRKPAAITKQSTATTTERICGEAAKPPSWWCACSAVAAPEGPCPPSRYSACPIPQRRTRSSLRSIARHPAGQERHAGHHRQRRSRPRPTAKSSHYCARWRNRRRDRGCRHNACWRCPPPAGRPRRPRAAATIRRR